MKKYVKLYLPDCAETMQTVASLIRRDGYNEQEIENKRTHLEKTRRRYLEMYSNDIITMKELTDKSDWIQREMDRLASKIKIMHASQLETESIFLHINRQGGVLPYDFDYRFLHGLIERITAEPSGCIRIDLKRDFDRVQI